MNRDRHGAAIGVTHDMVAAADPDDLETRIGGFERCAWPDTPGVLGVKKAVVTGTIEPMQARIGQQRTGRKPLACGWGADSG